MPMAEPVYPERQLHSRDPLHPSQPRMTEPERELPERATPSHLGRIPAPAESPRLNSAAETVGSALGTAVSSVRHLPDTLQDAKARFTVIRGRKKQDAKEVAQEAIGRMRETGAEMKDEARASLDQARTRAERLAHEYPLHVIAGAAGLGLLLGIGLRVWRDHAS